MKRGLLFARALRRLLWALAVVFGVTLFAFVTAELLPGDPARLLLGPQASAADVARAREVYGLDLPLPEKLARYYARLVHLGPPGSAGDPKSPEHRSCGALVGPIHVDLGHSFHYRRPVVDLIAARLPRTLELALAALWVQLTLGVGAGLLAAWKRGTVWDDLAVGTTLLGVSAPAFLLGLVLQYVLAYKLGWLPLDGYGTSSAEHLRSLVLPALTLGVFGSALHARLVREEVTTQLGEAHARAARARGASRPRVLVVHALRNALVPVATVAALELGAMASGAVVTERLFRWPGLGQLAVEGLQNRDATVIFGAALVASLAVVLSTLLADLVYLVLDPRLR